MTALPPSPESPPVTPPTPEANPEARLQQLARIGGLIGGIATRGAGIGVDLVGATGRTLAEGGRTGFELAGSAKDSVLNGVNRFRRWRSQRKLDQSQEKLPVFGEDLDHFMDSADASIDRMDVPPAPYNPLANWNSKHRTRRAHNYHYTERPVPDTSTGARTKVQEAHALGQNLRTDAVLRKQGRRNDFVNTYGPIIEDRAAVEAELKRGRYTRSQKKAMRGAARTVAKLDRSSRRIETRMGWSSDGIDPAGLAVRARIKRHEVRVDRMQRKIPKLDAKAAERRQAKRARAAARGARRAQHQQDRQDRKATT
jgi:hypothetical protein